MFHHIRHGDHVLLVWNLLLLLCVAVLPFTTATLAEYVRAGESELRLAASVYSAVLGAAGLCFSTLRRHALRAGLGDRRPAQHRLPAPGRPRPSLPRFYGVRLRLGAL